MNLNYEEVSIEEADRIIKTANLRMLAQLVYEGSNKAAYLIAESILDRVDGW